MNFDLTNEQKMLREVMRDFAENELKPIAAEIDANKRYPEETVKKMADCKMLGIPFPKEYGGAGGEEVGYAITVEELAKKCASSALIVSGQSSLVAWPIFKFGTEEQKQKYLVPLLKGEKIGAFALTEPNAGTDSISLQTTSALQDDHYILNGAKTFITGAGLADIYIIMTRADRSQGGKGINALIVEKNYPGFSIGKLEDKMGMRGSATGELIFENCKVPKENLLGQEGKGFALAMKTLEGGRIGIAAQALGIAQGALDEAVKYAKERKQFRKPIAKNQGIQWMLAEMHTRVSAARWLVYNAAYLKSTDQPYAMEAAMAKLYAAETAMYVTTKTVQIHGGYGYIKDYPVERMMRDAKVTEIYEGTSEVQKMVIAANLLAERG
jgi:butyryl-CoA dehydrogenase